MKNPQEKVLSSKASYEVKVALADMLKGGLIVEVTSPDQAKMAEEIGAIAVVAVGSFSQPECIQKIQESVSIPVVVRCRIGHTVEAEILEALFVDFIDESELVPYADEDSPIDKHPFRIPFIASCRNLSQALQHIGDGTALIRTYVKDRAILPQTVHYLRKLKRDIRILHTTPADEFLAESKRFTAPYHLLQQVAILGKLPVPLIAAGGIYTPADAALVVRLGADSVLVNSELFTFDEPKELLRSLVAAIAYANDPQTLAKISLGALGTTQELKDLPYTKEELLCQKGW